MFARPLMVLTLVAAMLAAGTGFARAQDIEVCFATADRMANGDTVSTEDKEAGHKACQAALAATSSIVQKSQIQDADFDIIGRPAKVELRRFALGARGKVTGILATSV